MKKIYPLDKEHVKLIGRTMQENGVLWLALSGSGIEFSFKGTAAYVTLVGDKEAVKEASDHYSRYAVYVNGKRTQDALLTEKERTICLYSEKDLPDAGAEERVMIKLIKLSEATSSTFGLKDLTAEICGVCEESPEQEMIQPSPQKDLKIEFIGDSITCGYGVDDENELHSFRTAVEDVTKAWAYKAAETMDADYSLVSYSGHGIVSGWTDDGNRNSDLLVPPVYEQFAKTFGSSEGFYTETARWDFGLFVPDIIVINLGTNDDSYTGDSAERTAEYIRDYVTFLCMVRSHNPAAGIICAFGLMGDRLLPAVKEAVRSYKEKSGDEKIYVCPLTTQNGETDGFVVDYHPTERSHTRAAAELCSFIKKLV